jgi:hypothetical protein
VDGRPRKGGGGHTAWAASASASGHDLHLHLHHSDISPIELEVQHDVEYVLCSDHDRDARPKDEEEERGRRMAKNKKKKNELRMGNNRVHTTNNPGRWGWAGWVHHHHPDTTARFTLPWRPPCASEPSLSPALPQMFVSGRQQQSDPTRTSSSALF